MKDLMQNFDFYLLFCFHVIFLWIISNLAPQMMRTVSSGKVRSIYSVTVHPIKVLSFFFCQLMSCYCNIHIAMES